MGQHVEMISVCGTDGTITPIRFRVKDEFGCMQTVAVVQVICSKKVQYAGVDAIQFFCNGLSDGRESLMELRYTVRTHRWMLLKTVHCVTT